MSLLNKVSMETIKLHFIYKKENVTREILGNKLRCKHTYSLILWVLKY